MAAFGDSLQMFDSTFDYYFFLIVDGFGWGLLVCLYVVFVWV